MITSPRFDLRFAASVLGAGVLATAAPRAAQGQAMPPASVGPSTSDGAGVAAESYEWRPVTILANGFVNGVVYGRAEGAPVYINTDMGGAYRLDGDAWVCLTDWIAHDDWSLNQMGVETLAADPTDPDRVYAAVGTYLGPSAVLRSADRGATWERTDVDFPMNGNGSARNSGQRMNVDPNDPARLLYGTRTKGLYESGDRAATWRRVGSFPATGDDAKPAKEAGLTWTLFDAASGSPGAATPVAYVGVCTTGPGKVFRTRDAGETWEPIPGQPGGTLLATRAALTPDGGTLFATFVTGTDYPGPHGVEGGAVYRCVGPAADAPAWTDVTPDYPGGGGWSGACLDPTDPATLYVTTIDHYAAPGDDIFRSRDGGATWTPLRIGAHRDDAGVAYLRDAGIHWTGDVQVNPQDPDEAYFTTGYGLYRTTNLRADAPTWTFFNAGFEQSAVLALVSPPAGEAHLVSAIGDRDGFRHVDLSESPALGRLGQVNDAGQDADLSMGTCNDVALAWDRPDVLVRVGAGAQFSNDGGITWRTFGGEAARNFFEEREGGAGGPTAGSVAVSADAASVVWAPKGSPALVARRDGEAWGAWAEVSGLPEGDAMLAADPAEPGTFYARTPRGLYASTDGGETFARGGDAPAGANWLRATPGHAGHLWLTAGDEGRGGLHHSTDGGRTWTRVAPDRLSVAKQVGLGAPPPGGDYPAVFAGGTLGDARGFFRSDDRGATWVRVNDERHQYGNVTVINGDPRVFGRLYVGTNGRGIRYGDRAATADAAPAE